MDCCKPVKNNKKIEEKKINKEVIRYHKKEKYLNYFSSFTGASGVFSSYQVCHSICLGVIALLSLIGITLIGFPFLFLQKLALPLWSIALVLFSISIIIYLKHKHISKNLLIFNLGAIIVGIPFESLAFLRNYFLVIGFSIIIFSLYLIIKKKLEIKNEIKQRM
ncbi:MAG: hypothetical protein AABW56_05210 [Nanoarchaeota archaeon]